MAPVLVPTRAVFPSPAAGKELRQAREGVAMNKIERLAGMPGEPKAELMYYCGEWCVVQRGDDLGHILKKEQIYGPVCKDEQAAIRAWNTMVRRIRKANAGEIDR